jgi:hypothetical protein
MAHVSRRALDYDLDYILSWVNNESKPERGKNTPASRLRVLNLIEAIQELNELAAQKLKEAGRQKTPKCYFCNHFPEGRMKEVLEEIEYRISEYPTTQTVYMDCWGQAYIDDGVLSGGRPIGESLAAHAVCRLTNAELINRISDCHCGRFFYCRFQHQRYCTPRCKQKHNQGSGKYKANRREYMRWYYAMYQSPNQPIAKIPFELWRSRQSRKPNSKKTASGGR